MNLFVMKVLFHNIHLINILGEIIQNKHFGKYLNLIVFKEKLLFNV